MTKLQLGIAAFVVLTIGVIISTIVPVRYVDMHATGYYWKTQYSVLTYQTITDQGKEVPEGATVVSKRTEYDKSKCLDPNSCSGDPYPLYTYEYTDWVTFRYVSLDGNNQDVVEPTATLIQGEKLDEDSLEIYMQVYFTDKSGTTYQRPVYDTARFRSFNAEEIYVGGFNIWGALISIR